MWIRRLIITAILGVGIWALQHFGAAIDRGLAERANIDRPPLYLPEVKYVKLVTLGYNNLASDILWFNTLNYFGKELTASRDYRWLGQMCELVTELDPKALHVYEFCSTLLSWVAKDPALSTKLLNSAIAAKPEAWRMYYLRGFNRWYFDEDFEAAREDFILASKLPQAPEFLASLASRLLIKTKSSDSAVKFLKEMEDRTNNEAVRKAIQEKRKEALISQHLEFLREGIRRYRERYGHTPQSLEKLVSDHIITHLPEEPFGGSYALAEDGEPTTTSGHKGLEFQGKTAKTGVFKNTK